jgi:hypothetical protein
VNDVQDMLRRVVEHLDAVGIPYMLVGSLASSARGLPRTTNDADLLIAPSAAQLAELVDRIEVEFYVDRSTAQEAFLAKSMFNIIDFERGCKTDLIFLKERGFDQSEFARRSIANVADLQIWTASAEDTILAKLVWAKLGESERQYRDAFEVAAVQNEKLDRQYLGKWAVELEVEELLNRLLRDFDSLNDDAHR